MHTGLPFWVGFHVAVFLALGVDLFAFCWKGEVISMRKAAASSAVWVGLSLAFGAYIYWAAGAAKGVEFITGYVIEYSLSMDNLFVFIMIFAYFKVEPRYQHKVLMCGVLGALVMRGALIALGAQLVRQFAWILYGFGAFVLVTGLRMFFKKEEAKPGESLVLRTFSKLRRVTPEFHGEQFLARTDAGWMLTPLALTLVAIEVMDLMFAVDSIPAVFAVTRDPFIVYTSNICAILGLRSFYFLLAGLAGRLKHLHQGVAAVLVFIGMKMLLGGVVHIHNAISLLVVAVILLVSVVWSLGAKGPKEASPR